jgi:thiol-disulfide isomerase/thioredoxin
MYFDFAMQLPETKSRISTRALHTLLWLCGIGICCCPAASAHSSGPPPLSAAFRFTSFSIALLGVSALVGMGVYRLLLRRPVRWMRPALFGVLGLLGMSAAALNFIRLQPPDEKHGLYGNAEEATTALNALLAETPEGERKAKILSLANEVSPGLRYATLHALGETDAKASVAEIERAFQDTYAPVRESALLLLLRLDTARGFTLLLSALQDEDSQIRETAIFQINDLAGKRKDLVDKRMVPILMRLLEDSSPTIAATAMRILSKLTGKPWTVRMTANREQQKATIAQWKTWWEKESVHFPVDPEQARITPRPPSRRDPAPDFRVTDWEGKEITLASLRGRVALINFWGTWCGPCVQEIPELIAIEENYRGRNVQLLGLAIGEREGIEGLRNWCKAHGVVYPQALCPPEVQEDFGHIEGVPVTFLLDTQGRIRAHWEGPRDYATFRAAIERVLRDP